MRKLFLLSALSAGAVLVSGCALTDYTNGAAQADQLALNHLSHAAMNCTDGVSTVGPFTDLNGSNTQQTIELTADNDLVACLRLANGTTNATFGPPGGVPLACLGGVVGGIDSAEASDWERFVGSYTFFGEAQVLYPSQPCYQGFWSIGGNKALDTDRDGNGMRDVRINTWFCPITNFGGFTCPTGQANNEGTLGAPEVSLVGHLINDDLGACTSPISIETVAVDSSPAVTFGPNIQALTVNRNVCGYSTFWGIIGRAYEGKLAFVPVKPSAGLSEFFAGTPIRVKGDSIGLPGVSVTASGAVRQDGMIDLSITSVGYKDATCNLSSALTLTVSRNFKLIQFDATNQSQQIRELARFAVAHPTPIFDGVTLEGFVPELGMKVGPVSVQVSLAGTQRIANKTVNGSRFGGANSIGGAAVVNPREAGTYRAGLGSGDTSLRR